MQILFDELGFVSSDEALALFTEAFTHRSAVHKHSKHDKHNERLEFLGDAVLELVTTEWLYQQYPDKAEGDLTALRSALVRGDNLAKVAKKLNFGDYLIMSESEKKSGGAQKAYLLANVVEAFIGALYLTFGKDGVETFIHEYIVCDTEKILEEGLHIDAKSHFQELAQSQNIGVTPHYELVSESGKDHQKSFTVSAYIGKQKVGTGKGSSKKEAQSAAAQDALNKQDAWT